MLKVKHLWPALYNAILYNANLLPLYDTEGWTLRKVDENDINAAELWL